MGERINLVERRDVARRRARAEVVADWREMEAQMSDEEIAGAIDVVRAWLRAVRGAAQRR